MKQTSTILITPSRVGRTPRHLGVNLEIQDYADRINLWDWLADSGATVAREFHPEVDLRREKPSADLWSGVTTAEKFREFREYVVEDPATGILWADYRFSDRVPWLGTPDHIVSKATQAGVLPLCSLGYATAMYPLPLVNDIEFTGIASDDQTCWPAAACAYEYYFAVMHRYADRNGVRYFTMINEPENRWGWWHLPPDFAGLGNGWWGRLFGSNTPEDHTLGDRYLGILSTQYEVLARLARCAADDVMEVLGIDDLFISGPTTVAWQRFWDKAEPHLDACDFHHYHGDAATFKGVFATAAEVAGAAGKPTAVTEFNRFSGGTPLGANLFSMDNALEMADMLMSVLAASPPEGAGCEFAALYLLNHPSTHRNYKHLLYGDMNLVDWTGTDTQLWRRGEEWYPEPEELQARFATPAYYMFRMLARCAGGTPHPVLRCGLTNPTSSGPEHIPHALTMLAVDKGECVVVNVLNPGREWARNTVVDLSPLHRPVATAVVRECSVQNSDALVADLTVHGERVTIDIRPRSLTQILFSDGPVPVVESLRLEERTCTPGGVAGLALWQTTRLRAIASTRDGERDCTARSIVWTSSRPAIVRADQCGLVQRVRSSREAVTVRASVLDGSRWAEVTVPGDLV